MRSKLFATLPAIAAFAVALLPGTVWSAEGVAYRQMEPEYHLTFTPTMPSPGQEVTVYLASQTGRSVSGIRWTISGSPATNAGVKGPNPTVYSFTPTSPGSYVINVEFYDDRSTFNSSSLELTIGGDFTAQGKGMRPAIPDMFLGVTPVQPRAGQPVTFTFNYGGGIPEGSEVRWDVAGGAVSNLTTGGRNKDTCAFVPGDMGSYSVSAKLYDPRGSLVGEVSLGFIPMQ